MLTELLSITGIIFEENPFEDEKPDRTELFDLDGNEVEGHETK